MNTAREPLTESPTSVDRKVNRFNVVNLIAYVINVAVTFGVGLGIFSNLPSNAELSRKYQTLVTPVGWAFSIWSIIFISQAIWAVGQLVIPSQRNNPLVLAVGYLYLWVVLAQAAWTFSFTFEVIWLSTIAMSILCGRLWSIVSALKANQLEQGSSPPTLSSYFLWWFPFTIHTGWITAATAVNLNVALVAQNASAIIQYVVALISLAVLFIVSAGVAIKKFDKTIPLAVAWALLGVFFELQFSQDQSISSRFTTTEVQSAKYGSIVIAGLIALLTLLCR